VAGCSDALLLIIEVSPVGRKNHRMLPFAFGCTAAVLMGYAQYVLGNMCFGET